MILTCKDCGKEWERRSKMGKEPGRCPVCRAAARLEAAKMANRKRRAGLKAGVGQTAVCSDCGREWVREPGKVYYKRVVRCPECAVLNHRKASRKLWEARRARKKELLERKGFRSCKGCGCARKFTDYSVKGTDPVTGEKILYRTCDYCRAVNRRRPVYLESEEQPKKNIYSLWESIVAERRERNRVSDLTAEQRAARVRGNMEKARALGMDYGQYMALKRQGAVK